MSRDQVGHLKFFSLCLAQKPPPNQRIILFVDQPGIQKDNHVKRSPRSEIFSRQAGCWFSVS